jgi:hypothetical protein
MYPDPRFLVELGAPDHKHQPSRWPEPSLEHLIYAHRRAERTLDDRAVKLLGATAHTPRTPTRALIIEPEVNRIDHSDYLPRRTPSTDTPTPGPYRGRPAGTANTRCGMQPHPRRQPTNHAPRRSRRQFSVQFGDGIRHRRVRFSAHRTDHGGRESSTSTTESRRTTLPPVGLLWSPLQAGAN